MKKRMSSNTMLSIIILIAMIIHTYYKWKWGTLPELLWGCNVASFTIILGMWTRQPLLIATGFIWHVSVGEPGYVLGVLQTGKTTWISVVVHSVPTLAAFFSLRRTGLSRLAPYLAFVLFVALVPISHYLTPPNLNINFTHQRLAFLVHYFPGNWDYRIVFSAVMLAIMFLADYAFGKWLGRPGSRKVRLIAQAHGNRF